jgi:hypothetical protein
MPFFGPLEGELHVKSSERAAVPTVLPTSWSTRRASTRRILRSPPTMGAITADYQRADVILIGVSRSGKTPTCIYMAMQTVYRGHYPFTEDDFESKQLPTMVRPFTSKLFGLTIAPVRGCSRSATSGRPGSRYASISQCESRCAAPRTCSTGTAYRQSTPPSARSRRSRAASSIARASTPPAAVTRVTPCELQPAKRGGRPGDFLVVRDRRAS